MTGYITDQDWLDMMAETLSTQREAHPDVARTEYLP
jgi:hypothetical protein